MKYFFGWVAFFAFLIILLPLCINMRFSDERSVEDFLGGDDIQVYFASEDRVVSMKTEEYIRGVLMAEMPAEFELEALKAQAVAARTYMAEKIVGESEDKEHRGAQVCTDSSHCQAYITDEEAKDKWGKNASLYFKKCKNAVKETSGVIAVYNNEPIKAVFHSVSGGRTENASDVWGGELVYLKSVSSPGEENAPKYKTEAEYSLDEFKKRLTKEYNTDFSKGLLGEITRTEGGSVKTIEIGNCVLKGTDVRRIFDLSSADFEIVINEDIVVFKVTGYGHGVGMSQYGANYYAKEGLDYKEILKKYYSGIDFAKLGE